MKLNKILNLKLFAVYLCFSGIFFAPLFSGNVYAQSCPSNTTVNGNNVTFVGELTDLGGDSYSTVWFEYGKDQNFNNKTSEYTLYSPNFYCINVSNLDYCSTYYYRAAARNSTGVSYGETKSFSVPCQNSSLSVNKTVRNLTKNTAFSDSVYADPGDIVSFQIEITALNNTARNVAFSDYLPDRINFRTDSFKIDGVNFGNISLSLVRLGDLSAGQKKIITFDGQVAGSDSFSFGDTQLINSVSVSAVSDAKSDTAKVIVRKAAVAGASIAPTQVPTGLTNNILFDSFVIPLLISLLIVWLFKAKIIRFQEWLDFLNLSYKKYKSERTLRAKIKKFRLKEIEKSIKEKN
jgi:uncharacterized repeat protein (TIGR01451 family)